MWMYALVHLLLIFGHKYIFFFRIYKKWIFRFTWQNPIASSKMDWRAKLEIRAPYKAFAPTERQACGHEYPGRMPWARSFCPFRAWGEWQGCGRGIAVRSTRRLAGGIQAKEEVRYDSPRRGFQWGHFCLFSLLFSCIQTKTTIKPLKFHKINVWYSTLSYIHILPFNT